MAPPSSPLPPKPAVASPRGRSWSSPSTAFAPTTSTRPIGTGCASPSSGAWLQGARARAGHGRAAHSDLPKPRHPGHGRVAGAARHPRQPPLRSSRPQSRRLVLVRRGSPRTGPSGMRRGMRPPDGQRGLAGDRRGAHRLEPPPGVAGRYGGRREAAPGGGDAGPARRGRARARPLALRLARERGPGPAQGRLQRLGSRRQETGAALRLLLEPRRGTAHERRAQRSHPPGPGGSRPAGWAGCGARRRLTASTIADVSDHGFAPACLEVDLEGALQEEGLVETDGSGRITAWRARPAAGATTAIVLRDRRDEDARRRVAALLARLHASGRGAWRRCSRRRRGLAGRVSGRRLRGGLPSPRGLRDAHGARGEGNPTAASTAICPRPRHGRRLRHRRAGRAGGTDLGRIDLRDMAPTLAGRIGVALGTAEGRDQLSTARR